MKTKTYPDGRLVWGDNLEYLRTVPSDSVDLIFGSPPYEDIRGYGIGFDKVGQVWVDWMVELWAEMQRVCRGLVAMVVDGKTRDYAWSCTPILLAADLHRKGYKLRKPVIYQRPGIIGTGHEDWLRNTYELIICTSRGKLPWSDNTACGKPTQKTKGSLTDGERQQLKDLMASEGVTQREAARRLGFAMGSGVVNGKDGDVDTAKGIYVSPERANPGSIVDCTRYVTQGGPIAHENEAPFPEYLAEFFILSFCPKGGVVLDPFSGGGTTVSIARKNRRNFIGIDVRESQIRIAHTRLSAALAKQGFDV